MGVFLFSLGAIAWYLFIDFSRLADSQGLRGRERDATAFWFPVLLCACYIVGYLGAVYAFDWFFEPPLDFHLDDIARDNQLWAIPFGIALGFVVLLVVCFVYYRLWCDVWDALSARRQRQRILKGRARDEALQRIEHIGQQTTQAQRALVAQFLNARREGRR